VSKLLIAGPCVGEESEQWIVDQAGAIHDALPWTASPQINYKWIFKCSFDKANRTERDSYRGLGLDTTLRALARVKALFGCEVTTDIHEVWQASEVKPVIDVIQIPAMLSRQTDLIRAAARKGQINIKVGTNMTVAQAGSAVNKIGQIESPKPWLTYRGTAFGDELVFEPSRLFLLGSFAPVIADVTHSASSRRGNQLINARVAAALDVDGLFIECHPQPAIAKSDKATQLAIRNLRLLLEGLSWAK